MLVQKPNNTCEMIEPLSYWLGANSIDGTFFGQFPPAVLQYETHRSGLADALLDAKSDLGGKDSFSAGTAALRSLTRCWPGLSRRL